MPKAEPPRFVLLDVNKIHADPLNRPDKSGLRRVGGLGPVDQGFGDPPSGDRRADADQARPRPAPGRGAPLGEGIAFERQDLCVPRLPGARGGKTGIQ
jgi:hypothetical protein